MADVGFIVLILALSVSIYSVIAFVLGAFKGYSRLMASARKSALVVCGLVSLGVYFLFYALLSHDFQLDYVASHTSLDMPLIYNISALWAGNAGSILFMAWVLSLFAAVMLIRNKGRDQRFSAYAFAIIISTLIFLLLLLILTANPFEKYDPSKLYYLPNPALENPGMVIHPPLLLAGYIAFTVPFALVIAALITRKEDRDWLPGIRMWALLAWLLLGVGNIVGAWWAYVGWGRYWGWDPIENAGLMPWLVGTAFLHSVTIQRRKGMLKVWTAILIILTFNLCIFGAFLNRSGFLSSLHNFANTGMEYLFLAFLAITLIGSLGLVISRRSYLRGERIEGPIISKENSFVLTNIFFVAATFAILLGTMLPWLSEKIAGSTISLESSFFNRAVGPIFVLIILLAGICILLGWRRTSFLKFVRKLAYPLLVSLVLCLVLYLVGITEWYALTLYPLCCFVIISHLLNIFGDVRVRSRIANKNPLKALAGLFWVNRPHYGGLIVHLGIVLIAIGIIGSSFYQAKAAAELLPGDSMTIENYTLTYEGTMVRDTSTRRMYTARLSVSDGDTHAGILEPEYVIDYMFQDASDVAVRSMPHWWLPEEDLYVVLGLNKYLILSGWTEDDPLLVEVHLNPLVNSIWIGGGVLTLGGLVAFLPYRKRKDSASKANHQAEESLEKVATEIAEDNTSSSPPASMNEAVPEGD